MYIFLFSDALINQLNSIVFFCTVHLQAYLILVIYIFADGLRARENTARVFQQGSIRRLAVLDAFCHYALQCAVVIVASVALIFVRVLFVVFAVVVVFRCIL